MGLNSIIKYDFELQVDCCASATASVVVGLHLKQRKEELGTRRGEGRYILEYNILILRKQEILKKSEVEKKK